MDGKPSGRVWESRNLSPQGKVVIFKIIALSKIIFQALIITLPNHIIKELQKILKDFPCGAANRKVKHDSLCYSTNKTVRKYRCAKQMLALMFLNKKIIW